ncbi:MAG TPA: 4Fe-4S dicluster domain-containing protein [Candidatus Aenigmarchaeota archaeon]|nr:4Fe-4S dicluster domain-containing protein [Candidatus Aenigmarchaeota archaeon]
MQEKLNPGAVIAEPGSSRKNKTGSWRTFRPRVTDRCIGCGICTWYCPEDCITLKEVKGKKKAVINYDYCKGCLICVNECPQKAIEKEMER